MLTRRATKPSAPAAASGATPTLPTHGAAELTAVRVEDYNLEVTDDERVRRGPRQAFAVFTDLLDAYRKLSTTGTHQDPFGKKSPTETLSKSKLDKTAGRRRPAGRAP